MSSTRNFAMLVRNSWLAGYPLSEFTNLVDSQRTEAINVYAEMIFKLAQTRIADYGSANFWEMSNKADRKISK